MVGVVGSSPIVPTKIFERGIRVWVPFFVFSSLSDPIDDFWPDEDPFLYQLKRTLVEAKFFVTTKNGFSCYNAVVDVGVIFLKAQP